MKICIECAHHRARKAKNLDNATFNYCLGIRNIVTGAVVETMCVTARGKHGACGPAGKLFTEVKKTKLEAAE